MTMVRLVHYAAALSLSAAFATPAIAQSGEANRTLTQVTDDVWRFDNNFHVSMVVDTGDGILVGDPINAEAAEWLAAEIETRFGQPVTHMIYSHHHADHTTGGQVFEDTATVIAHANYPAHVTAGDVDTAMPDITFSDSMTLAVGDKVFELTYLGEGGHGDDMIATVIRPDNVAFVVDVVSPRRLPFRTISAGSIDGLIGQIAAVEALDFDILLPGHSVTGVRQDATDMRVYLEQLRDEVQMGLDAGLSAEEIIASVTMADYADWGQYEVFLPLNIEGMIGHLTR